MYDQMAIPLAATFLSSTQVLQNGNGNKSAWLTLLVQMRQFNKCGSVRNNQLTFGIWCGPLIQHPLPNAKHQPHLLIPSPQNNQPQKNKESRNDIQFPTNCIILP